MHDVFFAIDFRSQESHGGILRPVMILVRTGANVKHHQALIKWLASSELRKRGFRDSIKAEYGCKIYGETVYVTIQQRTVSSCHCPIDWSQPISLSN